MPVKILYTKKGSDPSTILHPATGPANERFNLTDGVVTTIFGLIGYGDGTITYPDGRLFPAVTAQGSTIVHQPRS